MRFHERKISFHLLTFPIIFMPIFSRENRDTKFESLSFFVVKVSSFSHSKLRQLCKWHSPWILKFLNNSIVALKSHLLKKENEKSFSFIFNFFTFLSVFSLTELLLERKFKYLTHWSSFFEFVFFFITENNINLIASRANERGFFLIEMKSIKKREFSWEKFS